MILGPTDRCHEQTTTCGFRLVEVRGFEPLTPAVRRQCSTGLSYTPVRARVAEGSDEPARPLAPRGALRAFQGGGAVPVDGRRWPGPPPPPRSAPGGGRPAP